MEATMLTAPLGAQYLISPEPGPVLAPMTYSEDLQLNLTASGNPYHASVEMPESKTETDSGDSSKSGSDTGTDLY
jgi:hypothetical protein